MEIKMKLSARNLLKGTIVEVKKGQTTAHVRIDGRRDGRYRVDHKRGCRRVEAAKGSAGLRGYQSIGCHGWHRLETPAAAGIAGVSAEMSVPTHTVQEQSGSAKLT